MPITGFLKIPDIAGESKAKGRAGLIDVFAMSWKVSTAAPVARPGRGRSRARSIRGPLEVRKFCDAASPYLALATDQGKYFDEMVLSVSRDSGEAHLDYLVVTLENVTISSYAISCDTGDGAPDQLVEQIELNAEDITLKYTARNDDHSAGEEHEVTLDL